MAEAFLFKFGGGQGEIVFLAEVSVRKQHGKYWLKPLEPRAEDDANVVQELRIALEAAITKLNT
jgi:hypothetical protein